MHFGLFWCRLTTFELRILVVMDNFSPRGRGNWKHCWEGWGSGQRSTLVPGQQLIPQHCFFRFLSWTFWHLGVAPWFFSVSSSVVSEGGGVCVHCCVYIMSHSLIPAVRIYAVLPVFRLPHAVRSVGGKICRWVAVVQWILSLFSRLEHHSSEVRRSVGGFTHYK